MCGIIGYVGRRASKPLLLQGLKRLEYRGYDSAGIALLEEDGIDYTRAVGPLDKLAAAAGAARPPFANRPGHRGERPPADGVRRAEEGDRPERDRRELPRAARRAAPGRPHVHVRDRR